MKFFKSVLLPTIVGYVEMQAVSRINALQTGHTVNGNREFFAIGMANLVNSFFGGFVAFAATTRSKTLLLNGSKTTMVNFISGIPFFIIKTELEFCSKKSLAVEFETQIILLEKNKIILENAIFKLLPNSFDS